jgi:sucrose-6-phosphate hydrolase SacC (GH32 family)
MKPGESLEKILVTSSRQSASLALRAVNTPSLQQACLSHHRCSGSVPLRALCIILLASWIGTSAALAPVSAAATFTSVDPFFPTYHIRPEKNWINDPNGVMYDPLHGKYHVWMQYNPNGTQPLNITWYHTVSDDLVHFTRLGVTLERDETYDEGGCWSGSVTFVGGDPIIVYTCLNASRTNMQCAAVPVNRSDPELLVWNKVRANPLIVPPGTVIARKFRDPTTAWAVANSTKLRFAVGAKTSSDTGAMVLYESSTLTGGFSYVGMLYERTVPEGMLECPDFYDVAGLHPPGTQVRPEMHSWFVLQYSHPPVAQDFFLIGRTVGDAFVPNCSPHIVGNASPCVSTTRHQSSLPVEHEHAELADFGKAYAAKSFWDAKKQRRVWFGWIPEEDAAADSRGWAGVLTLPRVLMFDPLLMRLRAAPIPELAALRVAWAAPAASSRTPIPIMVNNSVLLRDDQPFTGRASEFVINFCVDRIVFDTALWADVGIEVLADATGHATFVGLSFDRRLAGPFTGMSWALPAFATTSHHSGAPSCAAACDADPRCSAWSFNVTSFRCNFTSRTPTLQMLNVSADMICGAPATPRFGVHRSNSGTSGDATPHAGKAQLLPTFDSSITHSVSIRVFVDHSVVEAFMDDGLGRVAARVYNAAAQNGARIVFRSSQSFYDGAVTVMNSEAFQLSSIWIDRIQRR